MSDRGGRFSVSSVHHPPPRTDEMFVEMDRRDARGFWPACVTGKTLQEEVGPTTLSLSLSLERERVAYTIRHVLGNRFSAGTILKLDRVQY